MKYKEKLNKKDIDILLALSTFTVVSKSKLDLIYSQYSSLEKAAEDSFQLLRNRNDKWLIKASQCNIDKSIEQIKSDLEEDKISYITYQDPLYPDKLNYLNQPPILLFYQGNINLLTNLDQYITIVGSRNIGKYSIDVLTSTLEPLCKQNTLGVVSGLALGVDTLVHKISLSSNLSTIAVIGSGLDNNSFYPQQNIDIKERIIDHGGLIISEYAPKTKPTIYTFPQRNRLLAALGVFTWVIQASSKSGSLITVNYALEIGKTVATTPASIFDISFEGNIELIKNGSALITSSQDILGLMNFQTLNVVQNIKQLVKNDEQPPIKNPDSFTKSLKKEELIFTDPLEEKIYSLISNIPQTSEKILYSILESSTNSTKITISSINNSLTMLELNGHIKNIGNNEWICI
jgi:DNA processing protein